MTAMGVKLAAITPSRGYCIELGAAFVIIYGTAQGWPLSTTHCQVGATVAVGLFEGTAGVNKRLLLKTAFGWIITLVVVGMTAALLVGPNPEPLKPLYWYVVYFNFVFLPLLFFPAAPTSIKTILQQSSFSALTVGLEEAVPFSTVLSSSPFLLNNNITAPRFACVSPPSHHVVSKNLLVTQSRTLSEHERFICKKFLQLSLTCKEKLFPNMQRKVTS